MLSTNVLRFHVFFKHGQVDLKGEKVVFASEMARVEKIAIEENDLGQNTDELYMQHAANGMLPIVLDFISNKGLSDNVFLLCAKGNNSGDAYLLGNLLLQNNYKVTAFQLNSFEECSKSVFFTIETI